MAMSYTLEEYVKKKRGSAPAAKEYAESFHCYRCHADPGEECVCSFHLLLLAVLQGIFHAGLQEGANGQ